ncbi:transcriptional regulator TrmB protein [Marine Group I thaumarchaeote SCGC AAA799-E16]|uniref:Transcriptional regulator TrmB protein n=4 Tax=Marine Group I TaxID=905826 RepID=A0A081RPD2_9ARCH|nr:transcriptional regulator TrmB protein [Marine Group I thaumarchaeote SCGC AAA799-N04]KER06575.1 transcriptional regulator TrmB protein [Marine Group I thaumarchaeote SCGC AAA799-E16]KFM16111.1 transcriptional regulator TrmB protein [Marine Group I thaumarchaeote SCGC AAA799-D11]KFM17848.1 transcriptional regulator TrmB protein [Marine Group I thaumarchaeote SCGC RSA3]
MVNEHALTVSLEEFGLSKYEAQAYVALIAKGTISAGELAYYSEIPRTKIYPTLLKLENKKLAIISKSKPIMCTAIAPEDAFDGIIHEQINKVNAMNTLVSNLKKASEESRKSRGSEEKRYFHISANNVLSQLQTMIDGSKSSIKIMADQWGFGLLAECKEQLVSVLRRSIDVKVLVSPTQICSESYRAIPDGVEIRASDITQNCFIFDETELLMVNNENGKGAIFSSTDILGVNQERVFSHIWKNATKTKALADMTKTEAQEIYKIIKTVNETGLTHILNSTMFSKKPEFDLFKLLEKSGVSLKSKSLDDIIEIMDAVLQITCSGHVNFEANTKNITVESKLNSGHSLPWVSILDGCLQKQGYKTRTVFQNNSSKGEKVHIKISKN